MQKRVKYQERGKNKNNKTDFYSDSSKRLIEKKMFYLACDESVMITRLSVLCHLLCAVFKHPLVEDSTPKKSNLA